MDDMTASGTKAAMKITDMIPEIFQSKPMHFPPPLLAGVMINPDPEGYFLERNSYSNQIE